MTGKAIMFMGTGSDVGKSLVVAGLARLFANRGMKVAPFKPQNMSNNAAVTSDGGEIGRAQALQARAARVPATVHMNPVLLKPEATTGAQIIVQGKRAATMTARDYFQNRQQFMPAILDSFAKVRREFDLVLVEGAGSPAEVNLRDGDLANMGFARAANVPALLVGDIHRGGVIASIVGTFALLPAEDRALLKAFLINKFHGDASLFDDGRDLIERETGTPCLGVLPHFSHAWKLPAEDAVALENTVAGRPGKIKICVLRLPHIANFDDLDPLRMEPDMSVDFVQQGQPIPGDAALVIIPGSKTTIADFDTLKQNGWDIDIKAHVRRGGHVLGLCGGYQMLGQMIHDPDGLEGAQRSCEGLGLLNVETTLLSDKTTIETSGTHVASGAPIKGYEIHLGTTAGPDCIRPFALTRGGPDGACSVDGRVCGTYLHGCLAADGFRRAFLATLGVTSTSSAYEETIDATLDALALHIDKHIRIETLLSLAQ
jgi:adenosylcobyric acid synthase